MSNSTTDRKSGPARNLTPEDEREIAARYAAGETTMALARAYNVGKTTIARTVARLGGTQRAETNGRRLDDETRAQLVSMHQSGATLTDCAAHFGIGTKTAWVIVHEQGGGKGRGRPRSLAVDDHAFDRITPESAYWMGFLFADGHIGDDGYGAPAVRINLGAKDRGQLEKLRAFLKSTHAIGAFMQPGGVIAGRPVGERPAVSFQVRSRPLVDALMQRGMTREKPLRDPVPQLALSRDFWRGILDGDGGLSTDGLYPSFFFTGHVPMLLKCQVWLRDVCNVDLRIVSTTSGIFQLETAGSTARRVLVTLYRDAAVALTRKQERAAILL